MSKHIKFLTVAILVIAIAGSYYFPKIQEAVLGAVSTLDGIDHPFANVNGYKEYYFGRPLNATSSVICALKNPYGATTTIVSISAESVTNGVTEANNLYVSTSTVWSGTSTPALINAFAMGTGLWNVELHKYSTTTANLPEDTRFVGNNPVTGASYYILGPNEWITWKIATTTAGTYSAYDTGTCSAQLKRL